MIAATITLGKLFHNKLVIRLQKRNIDDHNTFISPQSYSYGLVKL